MTAIFKNITLALLVVLLASSCKKGWLDVTSGSEVRSDDQFQTESGFKDALMGVYIGMTNRASYSQDLTWNMVDIMGQQYSPLPVGTASPYAYFQSYSYTNIVAETRIEAVWNQAYNTIANINNALANIETHKAVLNPISYSIIKGELLGLRAILHFDLMRLYGYGNVGNRADVASKPAIPYVTEFKKENTPQLTYTQTFQLLNKDITESIALLKEDPIYNNPKKPVSYYANINRDGFFNKREQRMNYYAVKSLQARSLLWQGGVANLANAALAAEEVIKDSPARLVTTATAASVDPSLYSEHLFNLEVLGFTDIINPYLDVAITNAKALFLTSPRAAEVYETANTNIGLVDYRYNTLLSSQTRGFQIVKLLQKTILYPGRNIMPLIKLPEMYYIAAEAYISTNPAKAIDYLNTVRTSRGILQPVPAGAVADVIKVELDKEYRKEFIAEGQLFFYYKRLGKTTFPGLSISTVADDKIYLLPYPANEIEFGNRVQ